MFLYEINLHEKSIHSSPGGTGIQIPIVSFPEETILSGACSTIFDENRIGVKIDILLKRRLVIVIRKSDKQKVKIRKLSRNK
jgi:hypothetical protein